MTAGTAPLKGIGFGYDVVYEINAVPEPATAALAAIGLLLTAAGRKRAV